MGYQLDPQSCGVIVVFKKIENEENGSQKSQLLSYKEELKIHIVFFEKNKRVRTLVRPLASGFRRVDGIG